MISVLDILTLECWVASRWRCQVEAGNVDLASERRQGRRQNKSHCCREDSGSMEHGVGEWVGAEGKEREGVIMPKGKLLLRCLWKEGLPLHSKTGCLKRNRLRDALTQK